MLLMRSAKIARLFVLGKKDLFLFHWRLPICCALTRNRPPKWGVVRPRNRGLVRAGYAQASDPSSRLPWVHTEVSVRIRRPWRDAMPGARWLARARSRI